MCGTTWKWLHSVYGFSSTVSDSCVYCPGTASPQTSFQTVGVMEQGAIRKFLPLVIQSHCTQFCEFVA